MRLDECFADPQWEPFAAWMYAEKLFLPHWRWVEGEHLWRPYWRCFLAGAKAKE